MSDDRYKGFSDKSQVGNLVWTIFWTFLLGVILASLFGCAGLQPRIESRTVDGVTVVAHIDTGDAPAPCGISHLHGCYQMIEGVGHVWYSDVSPPSVLIHEVKGHGMGMQHGEYSKRGPFGGDWCATVTAGNQHYPLGSVICYDGRNEYFLQAPA